MRAYDIRRRAFASLHLDQVILAVRFLLVSEIGNLLDIVVEVLTSRQN